MKNNQNFNSLDALRSVFGLSDTPQNTESPDIEGESRIESTWDKKTPLRIHLMRLKGNKEATVIKGWDGEYDELEQIQRTLKQVCGVGGSCKNNEIMLQGNHREKVITWFKEQGFVNVKPAGG
jgi:translation initiation factor 1